MHINRRTTGHIARAGIRPLILALALTGVPAVLRAGNGLQDG